MPRTAVWPASNERLRLLASLGALVAAGLVAVAALAFLASFAWPSVNEVGQGPVVTAGRIDDFELDAPVYFEDGHFWLVRQAQSAFIALSAQDPRGCTIPWRPDFSFIDPHTGLNEPGWFRDPCGGSTYDVHGNRVFGPSPRNLDQYPVEVRGNEVIVRTGERNLILGESGR